ncbi:hypothetical protein PV10_05427 [Exophiala mesophila]|uniref:Asl1-like glycosyl hydrolase catalytic domain-containing protein n=1 Tax=Exophiala mesophila TaxID=212818 RepID=A0A0D1WP30_EXOME|nr:uncharacterized protein PV10_05427 [Exophiala mesophila]KIV90820.1 hypothetical protein PV10_05427 [Exophiala mesophila]
METKAKPPRPPPKPKSLSSTALKVPGQATTPVVGGKRGLGWPWNQPGSHFSLYQEYIDSGKISWVFNWELWVPDSTPTGVEWIPCVRTAGNVKDVDPFLTDIIRRRGIKTSALLGFNEPEIPQQANLSVEQAVDLWKQVVLPAKAKFDLRLGSPGMSSDLGRSKPWLDSFLSQLAGHDGIDFLVLHWYGPLFSNMRNFLELMHASYPSWPIWLNEFACSTMNTGQCASEQQVQDFLRDALPWLDATPWIERYAYFGNHDVGDWVGRASNFTEPGPVVDGSSTTRLMNVARLYCEL